MLNMLRLLSVSKRDEVCEVVTGGSSGWQAPEQLIARSGGDACQGYGTDVFSFGMLLFYCLTAGKHPFGQHYERDFNILQVRRRKTLHASASQQV